MKELLDISGEMPVPKDESDFYWLSSTWAGLEALHRAWGLDRSWRFLDS